MKNRILAILAASVVCVPLAAQNSAPIWQFAPGDTKALIGIRWHNVTESRIGRALRQEIANSGFSAFPALNILDDIDEVVIASPGKKADDPEDKQAPVLIRVSGRFGSGAFEHIIAAQGAHAQMYRSRRVFRQKKDSDMAATLLDEHTFLLGDAPSVFAALDRLEWPAPPPANPLFARAAKLRDENDIWALFAIAPKELAGQFAPALPLVGDISGLELGVSLKDGLDFRLGLGASSEDSAAKMAEELKKDLKLVTKDMQAKRADVDIAAAAKKIQIAADKSDVRLTLHLDAVEVERAIAEAARHRKAAEPAIAVAAPQSLPPPPPPKQTIHIEGLDDGPKDVPLSR